MHQNASKCKQNERCKCFVHKIIKQVVFITYRLVKLTIFHAKIGYFVPSAQNASICIRMHQNVCRMKCANVLCTKISKNGFILHLKGLKSAKYFLHFVMEDPVDIYFLRTIYHFIISLHENGLTKSSLNLLNVICLAFIEAGFIKK